VPIASSAITSLESHTATPLPLFIIWRFGYVTGIHFDGNVILIVTSGFGGRFGCKVATFLFEYDVVGSVVAGKEIKRRPLV
jgi:hypothetical protein